MSQSVAPLAVSIAASAELLGVSTQTVRREIAAGNLKARRIGARVLIPRTELERFLSGEK